MVARRGVRARFPRGQGALRPNPPIICGTFIQIDVDGLAGAKPVPVRSKTVYTVPMKHFLIMRHAKSAWDDPLVADHDRPLNGRGRKAAPAMGRWVADQGLIPDAVLLSSAKRVAETWALASGEWENPPMAMGDRGLYMAWPGRVIDVLKEVDPDAKTVMLINHEPTVSALAEVLAKPPIPKECARAFAHYPTAGVCVLEYDGEWAEVGAQSMRFARFQVPKEL